MNVGIGKVLLGVERERERKEDEDRVYSTCIVLCPAPLCTCKKGSVELCTAMACTKKRALYSIINEKFGHSAAHACMAAILYVCM